MIFGNGNRSTVLVKEGVSEWVEERPGIHPGAAAMAEPVAKAEPIAMAESVAKAEPVWKAEPTPMADLGAKAEPSTKAEPIAPAKHSGQTYFILYRDGQDKQQTQRCDGQTEARVFLETLLTEGTSEGSIELMQAVKAPFHVSHKPVVDISD